jgi:hypothetical protein
MALEVVPYLSARRDRLSPGWTVTGTHPTGGVQETGVAGKSVRVGATVVRTGVSRAERGDVGVALGAGSAVVSRGETVTAGLGEVSSERGTLLSVKEIIKPPRTILLVSRAARIPEMSWGRFFMQLRFR